MEAEVPGSEIILTLEDLGRIPPQLGSYEATRKALENPLEMGVRSERE